MAEHISPVTIVKQGHANWVVLASFFVGSWVGALIALAIVVINAR